MTADFIYNELKQHYSIKQIAEKLNLHTGTIKRWELNKRVPESYIYDLNFLLGNKYDISKENFRSYNEFFTKDEIAKYCYKTFLNFLDLYKINSDDYHFIEPSCGNMSFYKLLPKNRRIGIDLDYKNNDILCQNFLSYYPQEKNKKYIIVGNPPFGLRGNLALRFINHANSFADFVAFILPPLFNSDGKGNPKNRVNNFILVHSEDLPLDSFVYPNNKIVEVATIFQIWVNNSLIENNIINIPIKHKSTCKEYIKIYSLSDGGTPSSTRNKNMLYKCDCYLPSTCFHSANNRQMRVYYNFEDLPHRRGYGIVILKEKDKVMQAIKNISWTSISFLGTNSSLNLRSSLIEQAVIDNGFIDRV